jgi:hypothetical protein
MAYKLELSFIILHFEDKNEDEEEEKLASGLLMNELNPSKGFFEDFNSIMMELFKDTSDLNSILERI